jgi:hypothetical protein
VESHPTRIRCAACRGPRTYLREIVDLFISRLQNPNLFLLAALMFLIFADPFIPGKLLGFGITDLGIILVLGTSLLNVSQHRIQSVVGLAMLGIILAMRLAQVAAPSAHYTLIYLLLVLSFLVFITALMTRDVLTTRDVTLDTISESLAVYMLMGLTWAIAYRLLEFSEPGSFNFPNDALPADVSPIQRILSFSFVTITTLGYGNITPATAKADALASAEALVGQIYITVLVARLVALQIQNSAPPPSGDPR